MERYIANKKIFNENLKKLIGSFIECWPEQGGHITIFYGINIPSIKEEKCSFCKSSSPTIIRYERDHWSQEFYDAFCTSCAPKRVVEALRGQGG